MAKLPKTTDAENTATAMIGEPVILVSAPAGPRRRAGIAFDTVPVELRLADLGADPEKTMKLLRADPFLKLDTRIESRPADASEPDAPAAE